MALCASLDEGVESSSSPSGTFARLYLARPTTQYVLVHAEIRSKTQAARGPTCSRSCFRWKFCHNVDEFRPNRSSTYLIRPRSPRSSRRHLDLRRVNLVPVHLLLEGVALDLRALERGHLLAHQRDLRPSHAPRKRAVRQCAGRHMLRSGLLFGFWFVAAVCQLWIHGSAHAPRKATPQQIAERTISRLSK